MHSVEERLERDVTNPAECLWFQDFFCEFSEQSPCVMSRSLLQVRPTSSDKVLFTSEARALLIDLEYIENGQNTINDC